MIHGYLRIAVHAGDGIFPIDNAQADIFDHTGTQIYQLTTNKNGITDEVTLPSSHSVDLHYRLYDVHISHPQYITQIIRGIEIYNNIASTLPIQMLPSTEHYPNTQFQYEVHLPLSATSASISTSPPTIFPSQVIHIPAHITVHLGTPDNITSRRVHIRFADYIANVCANTHASITTPETAIYIQMSRVLNRLCTRYYRTQGFPFDITSSAAHDPSYIHGKAIPNHLTHLAYELIGAYCRLQGASAPYFHSALPTSTMPSNNTILQILRTQYAPNLEIVRNCPIEGISAPFSGATLQLGSTGTMVLSVQHSLNHIRKNFPELPPIGNPSGSFDEQTASAVTSFQHLYGLPADGKITAATWNALSFTCNSIVKATSFSDHFDAISPTQPIIILQQGSDNEVVFQLRFLLNILAPYYSLTPVDPDGIFTAEITETIKAFQALFGLTIDGIVGHQTWRMLYDIYQSIQYIILPSIEQISSHLPYPGTPLQIGDTGERIRILQQHLNAVSLYHPTIPPLAEDGIFGKTTLTVTQAFQRQFRLTADGVINSATWQALMQRHPTSHAERENTPLTARS